MTDLQKETLRELSKDATEKRLMYQNIGLINVNGLTVEKMVGLDYKYNKAKADYLQAQKMVDDFITAIENQKLGFREGGGHI